MIDKKYMLQSQIKMLEIQRKSNFSAIQWALLLDTYDYFVKNLDLDKVDYIYSKLTERFEEVRDFIMIDDRGEGITIKEQYEIGDSDEASPFEVKTDQQGQAKLTIKRGGRRKGAGRKKSQYEIRKVSLALDPDSWKFIDDLKEESGRNQSDVLRELISLAIYTLGVYEKNEEVADK